MPLAAVLSGPAQSALTVNDVQLVAEDTAKLGSSCLDQLVDEHQYEREKQERVDNPTFAIGHELTRFGG